MSLKIALTGGIACGKSMAEACFEASGCRVLDADQIVHQLESANGRAVAPIVSAFGADVLTAEGSIDRMLLGKKVFEDPAARRKLEDILHPMVRHEVNQWLSSAGPNDISIFSAALLFECGWETGWDGIVCVWASRETQVRRMCSVRQMTVAAAEARLNAQLSLEQKKARSTWTLNNDIDDLEALQQQVKALVASWSHI